MHKFGTSIIDFCNALLIVFGSDRWKSRLIVIDIFRHLPEPIGQKFQKECNKFVADEVLCSEESRF